jgi:arylsulfatase A-like enzyme
MGGLAVLATATSLSLATSCATSVQDRDDSTTHGAGGIVQPPTRVPTTTQSMPLSAAVSPATSQAMVGHHGRPNILLITVDDASVSDLRHMPSTQRLVVDRGTDFEDALAPTPMCAPSRASLLTGQYAHNHGVLTVEGEAGGAQAFAHEDNTLPVWLHEAGYYTMFLGKYLNGYGDDGDPVVEPGWDQWRPTMGQSTYEYLDPVLNINGHLSPRHQYVTDLISAQTRLLLARRQGKSRPWFMWVNYVAPHDGEPLEGGDAARNGMEFPHRT